MSQRPNNTVDVNTIQIKLGDLAALYGQYKSLDFNAVPHIRDQMFSPDELKMLQYVDSEPKAQQLLGEYKAQQDALKLLDAAQLRIWKDGTISTRQGHDEQQARQNFQEGLNNATSGILGAFGQNFGQYLYPNDPEMANHVGKLFTIAGDMVLTHIDAVGGLRHETQEYIPNPAKKDLYSSKEKSRYSESLSTDPKRFTSPSEKGIPGAFPYNDHETEVEGERSGEPSKPSEANPPHIDTPEEGQHHDGNQHHDANPPIGVPGDGKQPPEAKLPDMGIPKEGVQPEGGHNITPANQEPNFSSPDGREIHVPVNQEPNFSSSDTRQVPTSVEVNQSLAPPEVPKNFTPADGKQGIAPEVNQSLASPEVPKNYSSVDGSGYSNAGGSDAGGYGTSGSDAGGYGASGSDVGGYGASGSDAGGEVPPVKG